MVCFPDFFSAAADLARAAEDPYAAQLFKQNCAECHETAANSPGARIPPVSVLKTMSPTAILRALEAGVMRSQAAALSTNERQSLANFLGTAVTVERKRDEITNRCPAAGGLKTGPSWSNWGAGMMNTRFQSAKDAGIKAEDTGNLRLKWAFAFPDSSVLRSQPAVYGGRVFAGGQDGSVYSLDAATGCVYWITTVQAEVRSGITVAEPDGKPALFFGDCVRISLRIGCSNGKTALEAEVSTNTRLRKPPPRQCSTGGVYTSACPRSKRRWRCRQDTFAARSAEVYRRCRRRMEKFCGKPT